MEFLWPEWDTGIWGTEPHHKSVP